MPYRKSFSFSVQLMSDKKHEKDAEQQKIIEFTKKLEQIILEKYQGNDIFKLNSSSLNKLLQDNKSTLGILELNKNPKKELFFLMTINKTGDITLEPHQSQLNFF